MKNVLALILSLLISGGAFAQIQMDKAIQLTGSGSDAKIEGIDEIVNNNDAANKIYVDTAIANRAGSTSTMVFTLASGSTDVDLGTGLNNEATPVTLTTDYVSGTPSSVYLEASNLPVGVTVDLSVGGGFPEFSSELVFYVSGGVASGTYPITITAVGGVASQSVNINLNIAEIKRVFVT